MNTNPINQTPHATHELAPSLWWDPESSAVHARHTREICVIPIDDPDPIGTLHSWINNSTSQHNRAWSAMISYDIARTLESRIVGRSSTQPAIVVHTHDDSSDSTPTDDHEWSIDDTKISIINSSAYCNGVQRALDYIRAGDVYQVNLTHPMTIPFSGSTASLGAHALRSSKPKHGSFICFDDPSRTSRTAIISMSPETFITYDATTNTLKAVPMKGTRPADHDPEELRSNPKDRAELNMIVDLMRNDLSRICAPSSVRVTHPRTIALHHDSVYQATATVVGSPRNDTTLESILRATFPPGSVTGAPKVRAMQIIDELESTISPIPRSAYCGVTLHHQPNQSFQSSVNIRTIEIIGTPDPNSPDGIIDGTLIYRVGAGIVADSNPLEEWRETLTKAKILERVLGIQLKH